MLAIQMTYIAVHQQVLNGRIPSNHWPSEVLNFTLAKMKKMLDTHVTDGITICVDNGFAYFQRLQDDEESDSEGGNEA